MSHKYRRNVREFDQLMVNFLDFADKNRVDVVIDFMNFVNKVSLIKYVTIKYVNLIKYVLFELYSKSSGYKVKQASI